jgi:hypothetical protein
VLFYQFDLMELVEHLFDYFDEEKEQELVFVIVMLY